MKYTAIIEAMVAAKATPEAILATVRAVEAQQEDALEKRRASDRERQSRQRDKTAASRDITLRHSESRSHVRSDAPVDDKLKTQRTITTKKENDLEAFKAELSPFLDTEHLEALVKHRRLKKAQMTAHSARLFMRDAAACDLQMPDAVDTCISRNWITLRPDWLRQRAPPGQSGKINLTNFIQDAVKAQNDRSSDTEFGSVVRNFPALVGSRNS